MSDLKNEKSEDIKRKIEKEIEILIDRYIKKCDEILKKKEIEIME